MKVGAEGEVVESRLEQLVRGGDLTRAASLAMESYGGELFGFLVHVMGNQSSAEDVFGQLGEDLWRGLPAFSFRASVRTWLYTLARHAALRYERSPWNRAGCRTGSSELDNAMARVRSTTEPFRHSDVKDRFRALRDALSAEDRALLVLRVDRSLPWSEVARVLARDGVDDTELPRETARLRKRFQFLKDDLRRKAEDVGIFES